MWRRNVRAIFPNSVSTMLSQEPCLGVAGVVLVQIFKQCNELPAAVPAFHPSRDVAVVQIQPRENRACPQPLVFVIQPKVACLPGTGGIGDGL